MLAKTTALVFVSATVLVLANYTTTSTVTTQVEEPKILKITDKTPLWDVMQELGKIKPNMPKEGVNASAARGKSLVETGNAQGGARISKKLTCAACHTSKPEYPVLSTIDPQVRLEYADSMNLPFLPGPPFYGLVNRILYFNDDYQRIYMTKDKDGGGSVLRRAHIDLRAAINTCNDLYAQGRELEEEELESILAYFWTMELTMGDLSMQPLDLASVESALATDRGNAKAVNLMRRYYPEVYPAHLVAPSLVEDRKRTSPVLNSFSNGQRIYDHSCLYCHQNKKFSSFELDKDQKTFKFLKRNFDVSSRHSIYDVIRYNPKSKGNQQGMPHYTSERMSNKQIQDLRFYIIQVARLGDEAYTYYEGY